MSEVDSISLAIGARDFTFVSASRHETIGERMTWRLETLDRDLPSEVARLQIANCRRTLIDGPLKINIRNSALFTVAGPFRVVSCPDAESVVLTVEATVEDEAALAHADSPWPSFEAVNSQTGFNDRPLPGFCHRFQTICNGQLTSCGGRTGWRSSTSFFR